MSQAPIYIGIAGGSCSGKTTLARQLAGALPGRSVATISLDAYYRDLIGLSVTERAAVNFDHPGAIDDALAAQHLRMFAESGAARPPVYDFKTHARFPEEDWPEYYIDIDGKVAPVVIVEGLFVLYFDTIRSFLDISVFVAASHDVCLARRIERDVKERGRTAESIRTRYESMTRPMYEQFIRPTADLADLEVEGRQPFTAAIATICSMIPAG